MMSLNQRIIKIHVCEMFYSGSGKIRRKQKWLCSGKTKNNEWHNRRNFFPALIHRNSLAFDKVHFRIF